MSAMAWKRAAEAAEIVSRTVEGDLRRCGRAELAARARRLARALAAAGTARGDRVATLAWNGHRHVELALAAAEIGATLHALDPGEHSDGIARRAEAAGFRAVAFDLSFMPLVEDVAPRLAPDLAWIALTDRANMPGPGEAPNLLCYEDVLAGAPGGDGAGGDREIAFPLHEDGLPASPDRPRQARLHPDDAVLAAVPMFRPDGWELARAAWNAGARLVLPGPWLDAGSLHDLIDGERVTVVAAREQVWRGLLAHAEREGAPFRTLRLAIVAEAAADARALTSALGERHGVRVLRAPLHEWGDPGGALL